MPRREENARERTYPQAGMAYQAVRKYLVWLWGFGLDGNLIFLLVVEYDMLSAAEGLVQYVACAVQRSCLRRRGFVCTVFLIENIQTMAVKFEIVPRLKGCVEVFTAGHSKDRQNTPIEGMW